MKLQNIEAEQSVLGSCMLDPNVVLHAIEILPNANCFYLEIHQTIYESIVEILKKGEAVDIITVTNNLMEKGKFEEIGGSEYLTDLLNVMPTTGNMEYYAKIVYEKYKIRRIHDSSKRIYQAVHKDGTEFNDLQNSINSILADLVLEDKIGFRKIDYELGKQWNQIMERKTPDVINVGIKSVDNLLLGLCEGDVVIMAGRPSIGKTSFMLQCALNQARSGLSVGIFSFEMGMEKQLRIKFLSNLARVDSNLLKNCKYHEEQKKSILYAFNELKKLNIYIDDSFCANMMDMKSRAILQSRQGLDILYIDYLQLLKSNKSENRNQELSEITRSIKMMAKDLRIPIVLLSQLSRKCEGRTDKRPMLSDLRDSGTIEENADIVMLLYRDSYYKDNEEDNMKAEVNVAKNRNGITGTAKVFFDRRFSLFGDLEYGEEENNEN